MYAATSALLFVLVAFAWVPPLVDRTGLAALAFAFMALAVGRVRGRSRPSISTPDEAAMYEMPPGFDGLATDLRAQLAQYEEAFPPARAREG